MAIQGTFLADFTSFKAAVQQAEVSLKGMETGAGKVETSLNRMVDSFSGRKIIQDAELMTEAINRLGGATMLTESEQQRVNAKVTEAIAKYEALGKSAPAEMLALRDATAKVTPAITQAASGAGNLLSTMKNLASAAGIGLSIGGIVAFGKSVFDTASHIGDLSERLSVSTDAVQKWSYAAQLSGATIDDVSNALGVMAKTLGGGQTTSLNWALDKAHLSFAQLRDMNSEDAFNAIAEAVKGIQDPMVQARVATELFGKNALTLLPAIKSGFKEVGDQASTMSADTIRSLKEAQDTWVKFGNNLIVISGNIIDGTISATKHITSSWKNAADFLLDSINMGVGGAAALAAGMEKVQHPADAAQKSVKDVGAGLQDFTSQANAATEALKKHKEALEAIAAAAKPLDASTQAQVIALKEQGFAEDKIAASLKIHESQVHALADGIEKWRKANEAEFSEWKEQRDAANQIAAGEIERQRKMQDDIDRLSEDTMQSIVKRSRGEADAKIADIARWQRDALRAYDSAKAGYLAYAAAVMMRSGEMRQQLVQDAMAQAAALNQQFSSEAEGSILKPLKSFFDTVETLDEQNSKHTTERRQKWLSEWSSALDKTAGEFQQMSQIAGGSLGEVFRAVGTGISLTHMLSESIKTIGDSTATSAQKAVAYTNIYTAALQIALDVWNKHKKAQQELIAEQRQFASQIGQLGGTFGGLNPRDLGLETLEGLLGAARLRDQALKDQLDAAAGITKTPLEKNLKAQEALQQRIDAEAKRGNLELVALLSQQLNILKQQSVELTRLAKAQGDLAAAQAKHVNLWKDMQASAEKYGIEINKLGTQFQQSQLDSGAQDLLHDWHLLVDNGADVQAVITGMTGDVNKLISKSKEFGLTIPEAMRPMLEKMLAAGVLTDDAGNALHDLSGIEWSQNITDQFADLVDNIQELIQALRDLVAQAQTPIVVPPLSIPKPPKGDYVPPETPAVPMASGGMGRVTKPTLFFSAGNEDFAFSGEGRSFANRQASGGTAIINIDGRTIAKISVPYIPDEIRRYELA